MVLKISTASCLVWFHLFLVLFIGWFSASHAGEDDIRCLESIKASLEDTFGYLSSSWDFSNKTEGFICRFTGVECWHADENKVLNIRLSDMGLKGNFPRGLGYCTSLTGLDLSSNKLSGTIPSDIGTLLPSLTSLDLSFNNFTGEIPKSLANCSYLNVLMLNHNQFTGQLPPELALLSRLKVFSVSNNLLIGPVPNFQPVGRVKIYSYANNPKLCGGPLEACGPNEHERKLDSFKTGFTIGYVVSAAVVFISFSFSWLQMKNVTKIMELCIVQNRFRRKKEDNQLLHFPTPTLRSTNEIAQLEKLINRMSYAELCKATDNFGEDNIIGEGKSGTMYKATLQNGWFLAVKRLSDSPQFESQIVSELLALARMRHDNLIPLLGFCMENNERLLVYKHMSNGNLRDCLQPVQGEAKILEWPLRLKIAMGVARGLAWLHHKCIFRVVHRNINSRSVLLDHYFEPKISNFGCAIMSNYGGAMFVYPNENDSGLFVSSGVWESDFVKKDVHDFGIVLLELITGKETITTSSSRLHNTLVEWINHLSTSSHLMNDAIDKHLMGQGFDGEILQVLHIASECVHPFPYERPTMLQVYKRISHIGDRYGIPCDFGILVYSRGSVNGSQTLLVDTR